MRVLIVEDELRMASLIRRGLIAEGLAADLAPSGEEALISAGAHAYDVIVLDVMLPGIDGFETCRRLRTGGVWAPVLMLTARDSLSDTMARSRRPGVVASSSGVRRSPSCSTPRAASSVRRARSRGRRC